MKLLEMLVLEILSKLSVKSLTRFRCVCKPWSSSFRTHHFISKHHQNNLRKNNLNLLLKCCQFQTQVTHYFSQLSIEKGLNFTVKHNIHLPFFEHCQSGPAVSGPCNGLVCLRRDDKVSLWNPSTREFKILPQSSVSRSPLVDFTSFDCLGFGFDYQISDYKVVRFVTNYFEHKEDVSRIPAWNHQVELYSLKSDSWKEISAHDVYPYDGPPEFNIYINGFYYWQASGNFDYIFLSLDMVNEKFSTLPLPEFGRFFVGQVLEFKGLLGVIVYPLLGTDKSFYLWVMNGSWTKQFSIESVFGVKRLLRFWKNGE
ncbi:putative F-box protein At4g38870 [Hibiscus syriacus]|uniref:putative F-box protein At4g38870 n=1 Tax=Hibiscus syriacus TaxID=106335 RepID=UPI001924ED01|nr:putative F-box protein At4g38870 [Hibiscus syriacus]